MSLTKCGLCGTYHDTVRDAMECCSERLKDDDPDAGAAPVAMPDGGIDRVGRIQEAVKQVDIARETTPAGHEPDIDANLAKAEVLLRGVADLLEERDREEIDPSTITDGGLPGEPDPGEAFESLVSMGVEQTEAQQRMADALEDLSERQRVTNAALVELIRTIDQRAAEDHGQHEPTGARTSTSVATWIEDAALNLAEKVDLDAVDRHRGDS